MSNPELELNIDDGLLILHDGKGRSRSYHRADGAFSTTVLHAIVDGKRGCWVMNSLLEADSFPEQLFLKHDSPGQPPQGPVGGIFKWASDFQYLRDER